MQHAEADPVSQEAGPGQAVELEAHHAGVRPGDPAFPEVVDVILFALDVEGQLERIAGGTGDDIGDVGGDGQPGAVAHGGINASQYLALAEADVANESKLGFEGEG